MKFMLAIFVLAAAGSLSQGAPTFGKGPLYEDLKEFVDAVPYHEMATLVVDYFEHDAQVQEFYDFLGSIAHDLLRDVEAMPEVIQFLNYLHFNGIYVYEVVNRINSFVGLGQLVPPQETANFKLYREYHGVAGLVQELQALVPVQKLVALYTNKMETSAAFRDFVAQFSAPYFQRISTKLMANPNFQKLFQKLKELGVFGTEYSATFYSALEDDFQDFIKLIPIDKVVEIVTLYLAEDEEVQKVLMFAQSKEFHDLVDLVENLKEYQELVQYLTNAGLDVASYIQKVHQFLGMEDYVPPKSFVSVQGTKGIKGMIEEIKAVLPVDKMKALYEEKLKTSKVFADFIAQISSPKMQHIIDTLFKNPTFLHVLEKAKEVGLDLVAIADLLHQMLGLHFPEV